MKRLLIFLLIGVLFFCACNSNTNGSDQTNDQTNTSTEETLPGDIEGDETMNERLITKEELFEYIQTHDVGLTIDDFEGIDVEDFLAFWQFSPSNIGDYLCKASLEIYLNSLNINERLYYFAEEKISVDSTDEEFEKSIKDFFATISVNIKSSYYDETSKFYRYEITNYDYIYIARTKDINEISIGYDPNWHPELLVAYIPYGDAKISGNICYSKNKKYMLLANPLDDQLFEYVKVFSEIND